MKTLKKKKKMRNFNLIDFAVPIIDLLCPVKYSPNGKFDNKYFLISLLYFCEKNVSWNKYEGSIKYPIKGKYLNQIHNTYVKNKVYDQVFKEIVDKYLKTGKNYINNIGMK